MAGELAAPEDLTHIVHRTWLLPRLLEWLERTEDRFFVLTGEPGSGKSRIMSWLSGAEGADPDGPSRDLLERFRSRVKAVHFCVASSGSVDPRKAAEDLARQMAQSVDGYGVALAESLKGLIKIEGQISANIIAGNATAVQITHLNLGSMNERLSFGLALRAPLLTLYQQGYRDKLVMLIDALDESLTYGEDACIARLLDELNDLPAAVRVRFLVTTRPDARVLKYYRSSPRFNLITDAPAGVDDVGRYASDRLAVLGDETRQSQLAGRISGAARGNFLYARLVLDDLLPRLPDVGDLDNLSLPEGLSQIYEAFLDRELGANNAAWHEQYKPFLGIVMVARGEGIPLDQIERILGRDVGRARDVCAQYLHSPTPAGPLRPFHQSFTDILLNAPPDARYRVRADDMHGLIAGYFLADPRRWREARGYALQALGVHLVASGRAQDLEALIDDPRWYAAHLAADPTGASFLEDLRRALRENEREDSEAVGRGEAPSRLARQVFVILAIASIRRLSGGYPPALITALVSNGRWTAQQARAVARQIPDPLNSAEAMLALVPVLPDTLREDCLAECELTARGVQQPYFRAEMRARLAGHVADEAREAALRGAFEEAKGAELTWERSEALAMLAPHLPEDLLRETLAFIGEPGASGPMRLQVLVALTPRLPDSLLTEARAIALELDASDSREIALLALDARATEATDLDAWAAVLERARAVRDEVDRSKILALMIPVLPRPLLTSALEAILQIRSRHHWARPLTALAERLARDDDQSGALAALRLIEVGWQKAEAIGRVAPLLRSGAAVAALDVSRTIPASTVLWHAQALAVLIPWLPEDDRPAILDDVVRDLSFPDDRDDRAAVRADFTGYLEPPEIRDLLEEVAAIKDEFDRASALEAMAAHLPEPLRGRALTIALGVYESRPRLRALAALVPALSDAQIGQILDDFWAIDERATELLNVLAVRLNTEPLADKSLRLASGIRLAEERVRALGVLAPHLPESRRRAVYELGRAIDDRIARRGALATIAAYLPDPERRTLLEQFATLVRDRGRVHGRLLLLDESAIASLTRGLVALGYTTEAFLTLPDVSDSRTKCELLLAVLPHLTAAQLDSARMIGQSIREWKFAARAMAAVGSRLTQDLLRPVLDAALGKWDGTLLIETIAGVAPHRPKHERQALFTRAITAAWKIRDLRPRVQAITNHLAPYLDEIPTEPLYTYWLETLHLLAERPRKESLPYLGSLVPLIARLGGSELARTAMDAIMIAGQRWP